MKERYNVPLSLLKRVEEDNGDTEAIIRQKKFLLEGTMRDFGYSVNVLSVNLGNVVTRYEIEIPRGVPIKRIYAHDVDLYYGMASKGPIRWEIPVRGRRAIALEVPDREFYPAAIGDVLAAYKGYETPDKLQYIVGKNIFGDIVCDDLQNTLISGYCASGKSMFLRSFVVNMLYMRPIEDIKFAMIDLKMEAFSAFADLPCLYEEHIATDEEQALGMLSSLYNEVLRRKMLFTMYGVRGIEQYNSVERLAVNGVEKLPYVICMIDEFNELTLGDYRKTILNLICKTASKSEECGIYFLLSSQAAYDRTVMGNSVNCMSKFVQFAEQSPERWDEDICYRKYWDDDGCENEIECQVSWIEKGTSTLVGNGDMLYIPSRNVDPVRVQGMCVTDEEICAVVSHIRNIYRGISNG